MARRFRRSVRSFRRAKRELIWVTSSGAFDAIPPAGEFTLQKVLAPGDWSRGNLANSMQKGAVLLRIVGSMDWYPELVATASGLGLYSSAVTAGFMKFPDDGEAILPDIAGDGYAEDWLQLNQGLVERWQNDSGPPSIYGRKTHRWEFDIKVKRKLTTDDAIVMAWTEVPNVLTGGVTAGADPAFNFMCRCLVQLP